jgi:uncharacterized membrane protein
MNQLTESVAEGSSLHSNSSRVNLSNLDRFLSAIGGAALFAYGKRRESWDKVFFLAMAGSLLHRAATGHCAIYEMLKIDTSESNGSDLASLRHGRGLKIEKSVTVAKSPEELFRYWRNFENLPRFMKHLESVQVQDHTSHWVVKAPAGKTVEWDAEIHNEVENELIAWRSLENADINNAGSVSFRKAPGGRGTEIKVVIYYEPPGVILGAKIAKLWGEEPELQLEDSLRSFKQLMEAGEIANTLGQPSGSVGNSSMWRP